MEDPKKILIIQLKRAGDVLVTTPVLPALRRRFPDAKIDFLTMSAFSSLLLGHPDLHEIRPYDSKRPGAMIRRMRAERYDWIIDFQSSPRSALLCLLSGAGRTAGYRVSFWGRVYNQTVKRPGRQSVVEGKFSLVEALAGPLSDRPPRQIYLSDEERRWAADVMKADGRSIIGLVPTHRRDSRRWPAASFAAVARQLLERGNAVWLFWGPGEESYIADVEKSAPGARRIPPTNLRQMAALLQRCRLVITNDNGPMHLAVATGVPTATVYGPTDPSSWNPGGPNHRALQANDVLCLGCNLNECPFEHECMTHLSPAAVLKAADELLAQAVHE